MVLRKSSQHSAFSPETVWANAERVAMLRKTETQPRATPPHHAKIARVGGPGLCHTVLCPGGSRANGSFGLRGRNQKSQQSREGELTSSSKSR